MTSFDRRSLLVLVSAVAGVMCAGSASAGEAEGKALATRWCAECHVIAPEQKGGMDTAPSFADVAARRDDAYVSAFLEHPHPPMAPLELSRQQMKDLLAYIRAQAG